MGRLWITWEEQRRNYSMAAAVGADLIVINVHANRLVRYLVSTARTIQAVLAKKPAVLFVQNPSFVLVVVATVICKLRRTPLVIDAHNTGVFPAGGNSRVLNYLTKKLNDSATLVIVSNDGLKAASTCIDATVISLPDPLPEIVCVEPRKLSAPQNVLFICSWADDEPFLNVISAGRLIAADVCIYMTGNHQKRGVNLPEDIPANVVLTGFLSNEDYDCLLQSVDVVVDLTTRDDCLVCGAYEGVSATKPLILSDSAVNRSYFSEGALYTDNSAEDLARCITKALTMLPQLTADVHRLRLRLRRDWDALRAQIEHELERVTSRAVKAKSSP